MIVALPGGMVRRRNKSAARKLARRVCHQRKYANRTEALRAADRRTQAPVDCLCGSWHLRSRGDNE